VQPGRSVRIAPTFNARPILATIVGVPAAAIVLAAASGASLPLIGDGPGAIVALWLLGSVMCAWGIGSMRDRFGIGRANLLGMPLGLLATAMLLSGLFGWTLLLRPIAAAMSGGGQAVSLERAAIVGVGGLMAVKWTLAWLAYLPGSDRRQGRRVGA